MYPFRKRAPAKTGALFIRFPAYAALVLLRRSQPFQPSRRLIRLEWIGRRVACLALKAARSASAGRKGEHHLRFTGRTGPGVDIGHGFSSRQAARARGLPRSAAARKPREKLQAAFGSSCWMFEAATLLIAIRRGFIASGISRTSSIWSRPLSNAAPRTWT
jgi:hypothetical protein